MKILNMNALIVLFFFISFFNNYAKDEKTESDSTFVFELKEFYDGKGVVFSKDVSPDGRKVETDKRISLTLKDAIEAEKMIDSSVKVIYKDDKDRENKVRTKLRGYYRQYWGIKSTSDEKKIYLYMYNFNDPVIRGLMEDYWDKAAIFITALGSDSILTLSINLTKRQIEDDEFSSLRFIKIP